MIRGFLLAIGLMIASNSSDAGVPKTGGDQPTVRIETVGHGHSINEARQDGFKQAIEQVVGQVVISDQEVNGDQLVKDFIGGYSAGIIDDYEILESDQDEQGLWSVKMNVAVASSKIAQRMLTKGEHGKVVNGLRLQAQVESQIDQRNHGDALITEVLTSYPYNAFIINSGQTEVKVTDRRTAYVEVPYNITMSRLWLDALNEALTTVSADNKNCSALTMAVSNQLYASNYSQTVKNIAQSPCGEAPDMRVYSKKSGDLFATANNYYFYDLKTLEMINAELQPQFGQQHIGLRINLLDAGGGILDSRCANINTELFIRYSQPNLPVVKWNSRQQHLRPDIAGQNNVYGVLRVHLNNVDHIGDLAKIKMSVEKTCN
jgi:hypothetical protein